MNVLMKIIIQISISILLFAMSLTAQPIISILPSRVLDLGDLYSGQKVHQIVTIKNIGTDTLRIKEIKPTCGCTAALLKDEKRNLGPSESVKLIVDFNSKGLTGTVTKSVNIFSNDKENPQTTVLITSFIAERLKIVPPWIYFYVSKLDTVYNGTVMLSNKSKIHPLKILSVNSKSENLKIELVKENILPGEDVKLKVKFYPLKPENSQDLIEVTTDDSLQSKYEIKVLSFFQNK